MMYNTATDWTNAAQKRVVLFAMSGLGKTHVSSMLRATGDWFHYSVDYRIGTRYMGEFIADNAKSEAMKVPFLRDLLRRDSISITSNISFEDLSSVSTYLGKPGDPAHGGLAIGEYQRRQGQFERAEIDALLDTGYFIDRAEALYNYPHFICDTGGSICEWVDPNDPKDRVLTHLANRNLMVWIKGSDDHTEELVRRFDKAPKPMAYDPSFLATCWNEYLSNNNTLAADVDPDDFIRSTYARALAHRQPRYAAMAKNWGITVDAADIATVRDAPDFNAVIAAALKSGA